MPRVEQRLDAEPVAGREEPLLRLVPQHERVLAAQLVQAVRTDVLVQVERDLAVRAGPQPVSRAFELALDPLEVVELAVHDDLPPPVLVRDRLIAGHQVDDAEPRVAQPHPSVRRDPMPLAIGSAMVQSRGRRAPAPRRRRIRAGDRSLRCRTYAVLAGVSHGAAVTSVMSTGGNMGPAATMDYPARGSGPGRTIAGLDHFFWGGWTPTAVRADVRTRS